MFYEKTIYEDDFPIHIQIAQIEEYPLHYHKDVEFVCVLGGEIKLINGYSSYDLKAGDIFTDSSYEVHGLYSTGKENVVAIIQLSNHFFTRYFPDLLQACHRTYVEQDLYGKVEVLRKMMLGTLSDYTKKTFQYKKKCIEQMVRIIEYLNENFNLFAFEDQRIVNFKDDNPVITERVSRILNYVYENHTNKITLEQLAEQEHLSTYYLSHLIREYIGMNFREFLCFARVEMSAIDLLGTDKKISVIARERGFSTTMYYEKFFKKWFRLSPQEYRETNLPRTLSPCRPVQMELLAPNAAVFCISRCLSAVSAQEPSAAAVSRRQLDIFVNPKKEFGPEIHRTLTVVVTLEDFDVMGEALFSRLSELSAAEVHLSVSAQENPQKENALADKLGKKGYPVRMTWKNDSEQLAFFGYDSIAAVVPLFQETAFSGKQLICRLRDQGSAEQVLKGTPACLTSGLIRKPSYYAYRILSAVKGRILSRGRNYCALRLNQGETAAYVLIAFHFNDEIQRLCSWKAGMHETDEAIRSFQDTLNLDFHLSLGAGRYMVLEYSLSHENSIFNYMAQLGFPEKISLEPGWAELLCTQPYTHVHMEEIESQMNIRFSIQGAGLQIALVQPVL